MDCYRYDEAGLWDGTRCCESCHQDAEGEWCTVHGEELHLCCNLTYQIDPQSLPLHQDGGDAEDSR